MEKLTPDEEDEPGEGIFHPNVYPSGTVCLSMLNAEKEWRGGLTVVKILSVINKLLDKPNSNSPAEREAFLCFQKSPDHRDWVARVAEQSRRIMDGKAYRHLGGVAESNTN